MIKRIINIITILLFISFLLIFNIKRWEDKKKINEEIQTINKVHELFRQFDEEAAQGLRCYECGAKTDKCICYRKDRYI